MRLLLAIVLWMVASAAGAQALGTITRFAGGGIGDGRPATEALIRPTGNVAFDAAGNMYIADTQHHRIRRVLAATGVIETFAGTGSPGFAGDGGPAPAARFRVPTHLAFDAAGNLYVADRDNHRIRRIDPSGTITSIAGNGAYASNGDGGPALSASLSVYSLAIASDGAILVADELGRKIRRIAGGGISSLYTDGAYPPRDVVASDNGGAFFLLNGRVMRVEGGTTQLAWEGDIYYGFTNLARDASGRLIVRETFTFTGSNTIKRRETDGSVTVLHTAPSTTSGSATVPLSLAANGDLFLTAAGHVDKLVASSLVRVAGLPEGIAYTGDGGAASNSVVPGGAMLARRDGTLLLTDGDRVRIVGTDGVIDHWANLPRGGGRMAEDAFGNVFVASEHRIYKLDTARNVRLHAGNGTIDPARPEEEGIYATEVAFAYPGSMAFDPAGNLAVKSQMLHMRRITADGRAVGAYQFPLGPAFLYGPMAMMPDGRMYLADVAAIYRFDPVTRGQVLVAGDGSRQGGYGGDGGPATSARLWQVGDLLLDAAGNLYFSDMQNHRVRRIDADGTIRTIAGNGVNGYTGDGGPATAAAVTEPGFLALDRNGNLYVSTGHFIRKVRVEDYSPDDFTIPVQVDTPVSALVVSAAVTPTGFDTPTPVSVSGGEHSIGCSGTFTTAPGTLAPGQSVCVRLMTGPLANQHSVATLHVGDASSTFRTRNVVGPGTASLDPASIDFGPQSMETTSPARTVTLTNTGSSTITFVEVMSATPAIYESSTSCGTLAVGQSCTIEFRFTPAADASYGGSLLVRTTAGDLPLSLQGVGEKSLVIHYYQAILRRAPDAQGKAYWEGEATRLRNAGVNVNEAWFAMAMSFFFSPEYVAFARDDTGFVTDLYNTFFNRAPDAGGLQFWVQQLGGGMPRENVLASFMFSNEFRHFTNFIFGDTSARREVDMVMNFYRGLLARIPDADGLAHWVGRFRAAQCQSNPTVAVRAEADSMSASFLASTEYTGRSRSNGQYVGDLYNAFLRRGGEAAGVQHWLTNMGSGMTRDEVRYSFFWSGEFQARVGDVAAQGCLQ